MLQSTLTGKAVALPEAAHVCSTCHVRFWSRAGLVSHRRSQHPVAADAPAPLAALAPLAFAPDPAPGAVDLTDDASRAVPPALMDDLALDRARLARATAKARAKAAVGRRLDGTPRQDGRKANRGAEKRLRPGWKERAILYDRALALRDNSNNNKNSNNNSNSNNNNDT